MKTEQFHGRAPADEIAAWTAAALAAGLSLSTWMRSACKASAAGAPNSQPTSATQPNPAEAAPATTSSQDEEDEEPSEPSEPSKPSKPKRKTTGGKTPCWKCTRDGYDGVTKPRWDACMICGPRSA